MKNVFLRNDILKAFSNSNKYNKVNHIIDDFINNNFGIFYKTPNSDELFISLNIQSFIKKNIKKNYMPNINTTQIENETRFIIENGKEVIYEESQYLKNKLEEFKNHKNQKQKKKSTKPKGPAKTPKKDLIFIQSINKKNQILKIFKNIFENNNTFMSIDLEFYEGNQNKITEIGFSIYNKKNNTFTNKHFIIKENIHLNNYKYVPNHKMHFNFGDSIILSLNDSLTELYKYVNKSDIILGHSFHNDLSHLDKTKFFNKTILDTNKLSFVAQRKQIKLNDLCKFFNIETSYLHNAGNDSYYTIKNFLSFINY